MRRIDLESFERYRFIFWNILKILENKKFKKVVDKQMTVWYYKWAVADNKDSNNLKDEHWKLNSEKPWKILMNLFKQILKIWRTTNQKIGSFKQ